MDQSSDPELKPASMSGVVFLTRGVSSGFAAAQRIDGAGPALDSSKASAEHDAFVSLLRVRAPPESTVLELDADPAQPDCVFIEDTLVALPGQGVFACGPHDTRRGEVPPVADAATQVRWDFPGPVVLDGAADPDAGERIEGGDVLYVRGGDDVFHHFLVGVGNRSNPEGAEALRRALRASAERSGVKESCERLFRVHEVNLAETGWLHLKSAVTWVPYVGFLATDAACPVLERVAACLAEFEETTTNRLRSCAEGATVVSKAAANALPPPGGDGVDAPGRGREGARESAEARRRGRGGTAGVGARGRSVDVRGGGPGPVLQLENVLVNGGCAGWSVALEMDGDRWTSSRNIVR